MLKVKETKMAVKKATTKKAVKKAPAKKAVAKIATVKKAAKKATAKRVPAKKTTAKKAVAKKAVVKKPPVKKATVKKVTAKKVVKKSPVKKATVKRSDSLSALNREVFDSLAPIPEFKVTSKSPLLNNPRPAQPMPAAQSVPLSNQKTNSGKNKSGVILLVVVLLFGSAYLLINGGSESGTTSAPTPVATPIESATPASSEVATAEPTPIESVSEAPTTSIGTVRASYLYTSTGIRLAWQVSGAEVDSVEVSKSEDGGEFSTLSTLMAEDRALRITKIDTKGLTRFRVTITSTSGESFSTSVAIRGRFTL